MQQAISKKKDYGFHHRYFRGALHCSDSSGRSFKFTLKHRQGIRDWIWVNDNSDLLDGEIHFQAPEILERLETYFSRFTNSAKIEPCQSQVSDTNLWTLSYSVPPAGKDSSFHTELLGVPTQVARWFALVREWTPWLVPHHGKGIFRTTKDAVMCSFLRRDGLHVVILAISGVDDMLTVLRDDEFGGITVTARNEQEGSCEARILAAVSFSHEKALAACMYEAREVVNRSTSGNLKIIEELGWKSRDGPKAQWDQKWADGLGYCTWNGLGQDLTEQKIFDALESLDKDNIRISTLIIDDNWQSLDNEGAYQGDRGWADFEANSKGFPRGLGKTVTDIRDKHPSIKHVAVWHAMLGYWGGVSPTGNIAKTYKTKTVRKEDLDRVAPGIMTVVAEEDVQRMYDNFYAFLLRSRIDGVKTDAQFFLDVIGDPKDRRTLVRAYQDAWTISSLRYMQDRTISCMSLVPQIIFHSQLPTNRPPVTLRNSDDFFPDVPESHPWHIWSNAYTALLTQHLNAIPDWDMFQTDHDFSSFHAAARCISGGPIYITDEPGKHDTALIQQMTAQTNQGATVTLRPSIAARTVSTGVYTSYDEPRLLKIGSYHGHSSTGVGILGVFNVSKHPLLDLITLREFRGVEQDRKYIVRAYSTGKLSEPMALSDDLALTSLSLEQRGWEILTSYPLKSVSGGEQSADVTPLGLLGKMTGAAALVRYAVGSVKPDRMRIEVVTKALGNLGKRFLTFTLLVETKSVVLIGIYISNLPEKTIDEDFLVYLNSLVVPRYTVRKSGKVLEVDIETAWKKLGLRAPWNNEITVQVSMNW